MVKGYRRKEERKDKEGERVKWHQRIIACNRIECNSRRLTSFNRKADSIGESMREIYRGE